jgi:DNA modification methylase
MLSSGVLYSSPRPPDHLKEHHPATFAESDVRKLIAFFTKSGEVVFDPFIGSGSTMIASAEGGRDCLGIELFWKWVLLAKRRMHAAFAESISRSFVRRNREVRIQLRNGRNYTVLRGDSRKLISSLSKESIDFVLTSPPYWSILEKNGDYKSHEMRRKRSLPTDYGRAKGNLGSISDYALFLRELRTVFRETSRLLKPSRYMCLIVSDFKHGSKFYPFHMDVSTVVDSCGLSLEGIIILASNKKRLYPYGMPSAFVPNIHHGYVLVFRKRTKAVTASSR